MRNFNYHCPTRLIFGQGVVAQLGSLLDPSEKILLLYGGGSIKKNGVYEQVTSALAGRNFVEFGGIEANPDFDTCLKARDFAKAQGVSFILAVGGGSVLDAAKFIAQIFYENGDEWELLDGTRLAKKALPLGTVLTLAATGSEMNRGGVISRRSTQEKRSFHNDLIFPKFSLIDPSFNFTLPERQTINGVVDAFVHTLEQYATTDINTPLQDLWAIGILRTLIAEAPKALANPQDYDTRANISWCATCALNNWVRLGVVEDWAVHAIGHELTAFYGLDHAQSLAVVLPARYRLALSQKQAKLAKLGTECFGLKGGEADVAARCVDEIEKFFISLGAKTKLAQYGIDPQDAADKISAVFAKRGIIYGENRDVNAAACEKILLNC